jgi:hypothetical protein
MKAFALVDDKTTSPTVTAQTHPYIVKFGDKVNSYQIINNQWHQVEITPQKTLNDLGPVKSNLVPSLNQLKKKVDAQRAAGNLTDWKINVAAPILESMQPFLKQHP